MSTECIVAAIIVIQLFRHYKQTYRQVVPECILMYIRLAVAQHHNLAHSLTIPNDILFQGYSVVADYQRFQIIAVLECIVGNESGRLRQYHCSQSIAIPEHICIYPVVALNVVVATLAVVIDFPRIVNDVGVIQIQVTQMSKRIERAILNITSSHCAQHSHVDTVNRTINLKRVDMGVNAFQFEAREGAIIILCLQSQCLSQRSWFCKCYFLQCFNYCSYMVGILWPRLSVNLHQRVGHYNHEVGRQFVECAIAQYGRLWVGHIDISQRATTLESACANLFGAVWNKDR